MITSGIPSILDAITETLQRPASILTSPKGSLIDGATKISKSFIKLKGF